jgi:hypothetical protein
MPYVFPRPRSFGVPPPWLTQRRYVRLVTEKWKKRLIVTQPKIFYFLSGITQTCVSLNSQVRILKISEPVLLILVFIKRPPYWYFLTHLISCKLVPLSIRLNMVMNFGILKTQVIPRPASQEGLCFVESVSYESSNLTPLQLGTCLFWLSAIIVLTVFVCLFELTIWEQVIGFSQYLVLVCFTKIYRQIRISVEIWQ